MEYTKGNKINEAYIVNSFDCGCRIVSEFPSGRGCNIIEYCPKHKAAPDMYEALVAILDGTGVVSAKDAAIMGRKALAEAEAH
jgi:hypothetical protein